MTREQEIALAGVLFGGPSAEAYDKNPEDIGDWKRIARSDEYDLGDTKGYFGVAYQHKKTGEILIVSRGTQSEEGLSGPDMHNNLQIAFHKVPDQVVVAEKFMEIVENLPSIRGRQDLQITFAGHSLGGGIAILLAAKYGAHAYAFNAPGMKSLLDDVGADPYKNYKDNIFEYRAYTDSVSKFGEHVGTLYRVDTTHSLIDRALGSIEHLGLMLFSAELRTYALLKFSQGHSMDNLLAELKEQAGVASSVDEALADKDFWHMVESWDFHGADEVSLESILAQFVNEAEDRLIGQGLDELMQPGDVLLQGYDRIMLVNVKDGLITNDKLSMRVRDREGSEKTLREYVEERTVATGKILVSKDEDYVVMNGPGGGVGETVAHSLKVTDYLNLLRQNNPANAPSVIDNSLLNVRVEAAPNTAQDHSGAQEDADWRNGTAVILKDAQIIMNPNVLNGDGLNNTALAGIVTDNYRPGAGEIASSHQQAQTNLQDLGHAMNSVLSNPAQNLVRFDMAPVTAATGGIVGATPTVITSYEQNISFENGILWGHDGVQMTIVTERVDITNTIDVYQGGALVFHEVQQESFRIVNIDPIVIDLDGDGIELKNFDESGVFFDDDGDGFKELTGWVAKDDGILVIDVNGNGSIDDMREVISDKMMVGVKNSLEALKTIDSNKDGVFDNRDASYNIVKVWQDQNQNGISEEGELKSLEQANIQSINLNGQTLSSDVIAGNTLRARTTATASNGSTKEVVAVDFISNPEGYQWTNTNNGVTARTESGSASYVSKNANGEVINVADKNVSSAYGNVGNDVITGDDGRNWLAGGPGADVLRGGAGDDVLLVDAEDKTIDGGEGTDVVQVVGDAGAYINMGESRVEMVAGGRGNDTIIANPSKNSFVRGGQGDDTIIGGWASDALSGEDGNDYLDGGAGNDIVRGQRGNDTVQGGIGDDIVDGGDGNDAVKGNAGNDILIGGRGNDDIDGGEGYDRAEYKGNIEDYQVRTNADGTTTVIDKNTNDTDTLRNVEALSFANISNVAINEARPLPVNNVITLSDRSSTQKITAASLLANDIDYQNNTLRIRSVSDAIGGTATLDTNGDVLFTPNAEFNGIASFKYTVQDSAGNNGMLVKIKGSETSAETKATVFLKSADMPADPLLTSQWYLNDIEIWKAWQDYSGKNIKVGIFEPGMVNAGHREKQVA